MRNQEIFNKIQRGVVSLLEAHRDEIENGRLKSFDIRMGWSRGQICITWSHEENNIYESEFAVVLKKA